MNKQNWVVIAQLPTAVNHFLAATFHFRVVTLYGSKIQICVRLARGHRRRRTTAQPNVHRRATQHDKLSPDADFSLLHVVSTDVTDAASEHDWLMVAA